MYFTATLLNNGQVLVVGGTYRGTFVQYGLSSAELYNPANGTFSTTGSLNTGRYGHTATLLNNGKVLIAGGTNNSTALASAELYDPATGKFTSTGSLSCACGYSATLLPTGTVLFSGGFDGTNAVSTAELYNPTSGTFASTGSLNVARAGSSSTLLGNGKVLVAGGVYYTGVIPYTAVAHYLASAELYDPASGTFTLTGSLHTARSGQSATLLKNGNVLLAAGQNDNTQNSGYLSSAELYSPATGKFTVTGSLNTPRILHTAHLLSSGQVLIVAGNHFGPLASAELYDPTSGTFSNTASLNTPRQGHAAALLTNGQVLAAGGNSARGGKTGWLASAELFH